MKTVITKQYNYKQLRGKGQPCSVLQEFDFQGTKVDFVPMPVEGCKIEAVSMTPLIHEVRYRWVKDLSAYETLQLIERIDEPIRYYSKYHDNEDYAWLEILNEDSDLFDSV